ncbi:MAG: LysM peptidoglycan-binding domain-containing protein, partial [Burkholderiales bacterium]
MISLHRLTRHTLYSSTLIAVLALGQAWANNLTVTPTQRDRAELVAQSGVALTELAENAPDSYTVKRGDTLWDISTLFLKRPWSWPELWGMNKEQIKNPHLIYPGQVLLLVKSEGRATLRMAQQVAGASSDVVKLSPRIRAEDVRAKAIA